MAYSYRGQVVFSDRDSDGVIDVVDEGSALRSLQFGSEAKQSTMFVRSPAALALAYTQCLMTSLLFGEALERVLVLGLGGGSVPKFLLDKLPTCRIDAVEKREKIVNVARRFFAVPTDNRLTITVGDGLAYLANSVTTPYDLIVVDIHDSHGMSPVVARTDFFPACRTHLASRGILAINLWYGDDQGTERTVRKQLELNFPGQVLYLPVSGKRNCVALAREHGFACERSELVNSAQHWKERTGIEFSDLLSELYRHNPDQLF